MTGQIAFARTLRALDSDNFRGSKMGLFFAIILLAAWTVWLFAASIPQYEISPHTHLDLDYNSAVADLPSTSNIHPGQPTQITTNGGQIIQAQVEKVINEPTSTHAHLTLSSTTPATSHQPPVTTGIEVGSTSPATLLLR